MKTLFLGLWIPLVVAGCDACCDRDAVDYTPIAREGDWPVSTPEAEGLDPDRFARLYCDAAKETTLYGLVVVKDGKLVAEGYFNAGGIDQLGTRQSVTKSVTSAVVGVALKEGCIPSTDAKILDYFPEAEVTDARKREITLEQMLQMRAGFAWEETDPKLMDVLWSGKYVDALDDYPLVSDPGAAHHYCNVSADWLAISVSRTCEAEVAAFARQRLFEPIGAELGAWPPDADGYTQGAGGIELTARDMARFGQLYLDDGVVGETRVLPEGWVERSLRSYSSEFEHPTPGPLTDYGYGYLWWSAQAGEHRVNFAWGHGGNFIFLVRELDLVVVLTADPFFGPDAPGSWSHERAHLALAARFIADL